MKSLSKTQPKTRLLPIMALGIASFALIACQQEPETEPSLEEDIAAEQAVPMSAEPAEPNDTVVAPDATLNEVQDDTVAEVNTGITQITYLCAPELKVDVTYKDESN